MASGSQQYRERSACIRVHPRPFCSCAGCRSLAFGDQRSSAAHGILGMPFGALEQAIADLRAGKFVVVADDEDRENEGDLICAAQLVTPEMINFMLRAKGMICLALTGERVDQLAL